MATHPISIYEIPLNLLMSQALELTKVWATQAGLEAGHPSKLVEVYTEIYDGLLDHLISGSGASRVDTAPTKSQNDQP